ncbi:MAG: response regulator transcription factor [bacterium]|nr:response regulator transcription factor [bacterium]
MKKRILLADDHQIVREGLRSLFAKEEDLEVVAEAENGRKAVRLALDLAPDVVVMDVAMRDLNGIEATRQILAKRPTTKVLALSIHSNKRFVVEVLKAGASGYLLKDCAFEELVHAIRAVIANQSYLSPEITGAVIDDVVRGMPVNGDSASLRLSNREREVLQLLAEGRSAREIAHRLHVSVKTVDTHRRHIMKKLNLHSVAELTKYAIREGLTSIDR